MTLLFDLFASLALYSGFRVIQSKNPVHSVLALILVFLHVGALFLLLDQDFFAMLFLVVYVGAIAVLFLFVVMMLNIQPSPSHKETFFYFPIAGVFGFLFLTQLLLVEESFTPESVDYVNWGSPKIQIIKAIGQSLYTDYILFFLTASLILLVAMVGAIVLTLRVREGVKRQEVFEQNTRAFTQTVQKIQEEKK